MSESETPAHSRFGGSKADRWLNCPGSVDLTATMPPMPSSKYAIEGTCAHELGELCLTEGQPDARAFIGRRLGDDEMKAMILVTDEMCIAVNVYLDAVALAMGEDPGCILLVEQRFVFDLATAEKDEVFGANDAMVYNPVRKKLTVFDYKHGAGMSVSAEDNAQLKFYAAGAAFAHDDWPINEIEIVIVQPRAKDADDQEEPGVKRWPMDVLELLEFRAKIEEGVAAAKAKNPPLVPGPWCKKTFCEAAAVCPARQQQAMHEAGLDFKDVAVIKPKDLPQPRDIDTKKLGMMLAGFEILEGWIQQTRDFAFGMAQSGVPIPGWKLVDKMGRRHWIEDEGKIADYMIVMHGLAEDDVRPRKLVTITEAEKLLKLVVPKDQLKTAKDDLELAFTLKESSGLTLVADSDKRESVNSAQRDFGDVADKL